MALSARPHGARLHLSSAPLRHEEKHTSWTDMMEKHVLRSGVMDEQSFGE